MTLIKKDMPASEVERVLGKPDDVLTDADPEGIHSTGTREIWCYGSAGHLGFPTLGQVYIDNRGNAQYAFGPGEPLSTTAFFKEDELRRLLCIIDAAPGCSAMEFDPLRLIKVVNTLQPLGKEKALAAIEEYERVNTGFFSSHWGGLFLVLRVLFDVPEDPGYMPRVGLGAPWPAEPKNLKLMPRFPIAIIDDIPLLLINGYNLEGRPEPIETHIEYFKARGRLRSALLAPTNNPLDVLSTLERSPEWLELVGLAGTDYARAQIRNQALKLVDSVYRLESDVYGSRIGPDKGADARWRQMCESFSHLGAHWDPHRMRYEFKDGTALAPENHIHLRSVWKLTGFGEDAKIVFPA